MSLEEMIERFVEGERHSQWANHRMNMSIVTMALSIANVGAALVLLLAGNWLAAIVAAMIHLVLRVVARDQFALGADHHDRCMAIWGTITDATPTTGEQGNG